MARTFKRRTGSTPCSTRPFSLSRVIGAQSVSELQVELSGWLWITTMDAKKAIRRISGARRASGDCSAAPATPSLAGYAMTRESGTEWLAIYAYLPPASFRLDKPLEQSPSEGNSSEFDPEAA